MAPVLRAPGILAAAMVQVVRPALQFAVLVFVSAVVEEAVAVDAPTALWFVERDAFRFLQIAARADIIAPTSCAEAIIPVARSILWIVAMADIVKQARCA